MQTAQITGGKQNRVPHVRRGSIATDLGLFPPPPTGPDLTHLFLGFYINVFKGKELLLSTIDSQLTTVLSAARPPARSSKGMRWYMPFT
jgi:hypothetical protein